MFQSPRRLCILLCLFCVSVSAAAAVDGSWVPSSPFSGSFSSFLFDPAHPDIMLAASADPFDPALYRSTDRGISWTPVKAPWTRGGTVLQRRSRTECITFGSNDLSSSIFSSTDGGLNWKMLTPRGLRLFLQTFIVHPARPNILYGVDFEDFYASIDGGRTWKLRARRVAGDIAADPGDSRVVYVQTNSTLMKTTDAGLTWSSKWVGPAGYVGYNSVLLNPANPRIVYVGGDLGVFRSLNGGATFRQTSCPCSGTKIAIDPKRNSTLYVSGRGQICKSTNGGDTWMMLPGPLLVSYYPSPGALAVHPLDSQMVFLAGASGEGIFRSPNGGRNWPSASRGIHHLSILQIHSHPARPNRIFAQTIYAQVYASVNGGSSWKLIRAFLSSFIFAFVIHPADPDLLFAATETRVAISKDGGKHWSFRDPPVPNGCCIISLAADPRKPNVIYAGRSNGLAKSTDRGLTWTDLSRGLSDRYVRSLAVDPADSMHLIAGVGQDAGRLSHSHDGGLTWDGGFRLSTGWVTQLEFHTARPNIVNALSGPVLWSSTDNGRNWRQAAAVPEASYFEYDATHPSTIFAGSGSRSVMVSENDGNTWMAFTLNGMTATIITDLETVSSHPGSYRVATNEGLFTFVPAP